MTARSKTTKTRGVALGWRKQAVIAPKKSRAPDPHDSTGAMAAAWFGTPGAGAAIERVFGAKREKS